MATIQELITNAYDQVYFTKELRRKNEGKKENKRLSNLDTIIIEEARSLVRILQFFGLPSGYDTKNTINNEHKITDAKLSVIKILKGLAGWNKNNTPSLNLLLAIIFFPLNLVITASRLALNIVKLFTEFFPYFFIKWGEGVLDKLSACVTGNTYGTGTRVLAAVAFAFLWVSWVAFQVLYFVGRATTSPADSLRAAFTAGESYANENFNHPIASKILGGFLALVSLATTACVYTILFPLGIKLLITQAPAVLPAIANGISQFIGIFGAQAGASVAAFFTTTLPAFLSSFGAVASVSSFLSTFALSTPILGGLALLGLIIGATGTTTTAAVDKLAEMSPDDDNWPEPEDVFTQIGDAVAAFPDDVSETWNEFKFWTSKKGEMLKNIFNCTEGNTVALI